MTRISPHEEVGGGIREGGIPNPISFFFSVCLCPRPGVGPREGEGMTAKMIPRSANLLGTIPPALDTGFSANTIPGCGEEENWKKGSPVP